MQQVCKIALDCALVSLAQIFQLLCNIREIELVKRAAANTFDLITNPVHVIDLISISDIYRLNLVTKNVEMNCIPKNQVNLTESAEQIFGPTNELHHELII